MANIYDRVLKEIIEPALPPLAQIALKLKYAKVLEIEDKIQYTLEREGDHLKMLVFEDEQKRQILHLEFHLPDEDIGGVMLLKKGMLNVLFELLVLQFVFYLGDKKELKNLKPYFKDAYTEHRFEVIRVKSIDYRQFLEADVPEAVTWAILADHHGQAPETVIKEILHRIDALSKDKTERGQHIRRLEVLSKLRKLQPLFIKISNDMSFLYDLKTDIRYRQGKTEGKAEGIAEGKAKGKAEGIAEGKAKGELKKARTAATKMLKTGRFAPEEIADFLEVSVEFVKEIQLKLAKKKKP